ncbi:MAG: hypothetical protein AAGA81_17945 [Acidobacteriota bacterium]
MEELAVLVWGLVRCTLAVLGEIAFSATPDLLALLWRRLKNR